MSDRRRVGGRGSRIGIGGTTGNNRVSGSGLHIIWLVLLTFRGTLLPTSTLITEWVNIISVLDRIFV